MQIALLLLVFLGTAVIQFFIGGMRPIFAIPGYSLIALGGLLSILELGKSRPLPSAACLVSSVVFFGYIIGRSYFSPVEYLSRPDRWLALACLAVYLLVALYLTDPKLRMALLIGFFVLAVGHFVVGIIQFTKAENFLPLGYLRADYGRRASGFYVCPNHFASLLEMLLVAATALLFWSRVGVKSRLVLLYFVGLALVGIAITGSRGGYLSTGFALLALLLLSLGVVRRVMPDRFLTITCASLLILLAICAGGVAVMKKDLLLASRLGTLIDTGNMRVQLWQAAIQQFRQQPAVGTGSGTYLYLGRLHRSAELDADPVWVHNDYLHLLAEYGVAGAVTFLAFLAAHLWRGFAAWKALRDRMWSSNLRTSNSLALNVAALAAVAAMLAHSVVDFNLHIPGNALLLAMLAGFLANPPLGKPEASSGAWLVSGCRILVPLLAVALLVNTLPHVRGEWFAEKARVALRDGRYFPAVREAQAGLRVEKTDPNLYFYLGESRRLFGNSLPNDAARRNMNEAAIQAFDAALKLYPQDEKLWVKKSQALDLIGKHDEAKEHLDRALALDPRLPALNTYYAAHYELLGQHALAINYYDKARNHELAQAGKKRLLEHLKEDAAR